MQHLFSFCAALALLALLSSTAVAQQAGDGPTCTAPVGTWQNNMGSILVIESLDAATGMLEGKYKSASGTDAVGYPLIGWLNDATVSPDNPCKDCKGDHATAYAFTVRWGDIGSITAWTGTCAVVDGQPTLTTGWDLVRPNSSYSWDHTVTGNATFVPMNNR